jgi:hypothetical protein
VGSYRAKVAGRSDEAVAAAFVEHVRGTPASERELALLRDAFDVVRGAAVDRVVTRAAEPGAA